MKEQLEQRLRELKTEYETGQKMLAELEARQASLRETLLRISGAIQVLEEELARFDGRPAEAEILEPEEVAEAVPAGDLEPT